MNEHMPQGEGQRRVEIGLDGTPFEVWESVPQPRQPVSRPPAVMDSVDGPYFPRGTAETAMLETPRRTMEFDHYAWYSIGLGGAAFIGAGLGWAFNGAGMPALVGLGFAAAGAYFGMRSHNAGLRGFCTNGRLGLAGVIVSGVAAAGIVGFVVRAFAQVATVLHNA